MDATAFSSPAVDCGDPGTPTNGQRNISGTSYALVVNYACNVGYAIQGLTSRTCQSNGQWNGSMPQCICKLANGLHCIYVSCIFHCYHFQYVKFCALCRPCQNGGNCTAIAG